MLLSYCFNPLCDLSRYLKYSIVVLRRVNAINALIITSGSKILDGIRNYYLFTAIILRVAVKNIYRIEAHSHYILMA